MPWARSYCPLPFPSAGDRWFRACGAYMRKLSHVISLYLTQSHRIALLSWQKDLTLQHEHDSWVGPPPDWPRQTSRLPCRIHVSTVFDILTHKGRAQPVTGQAPPPSAPKREEKSPTSPRAGSRAPAEPPRRRRSVAF